MIEPWIIMAHLIEVNYGGHVDWDEEFFECPECGEPIYKCDWQEEDYFMGHPYYGTFYCPVCESVID